MGDTGVQIKKFNFFVETLILLSSFSSWFETEQHYSIVLIFTIDQLIILVFLSVQIFICLEIQFPSHETYFKEGPQANFPHHTLQIILN